MALRTIRVEEDEILRKKSKEVKQMTDRTSELIDDMIETVHEANGAGLAAVQVGVLKRLCIVTVEPPEPEYDENDNELPIDPLIHNNGEDLVIINPQVIVLDEETQRDTEGCLSFPGLWGYVVRPNHVLLKAQDRNLQPYEVEAKGLFARAICHECDHMDGIVYIDKVENGQLYEVGAPNEEEAEEDEALTQEGETE